MRAHERDQLPFLRAVSDFDIVIEIGFYEEQGSPLGLKQLYATNICSPATIRRRLAELVHKGVVLRRPVMTDRRAAVLLISPATYKLFRRFAALLTAVSDMHFK